MVRGCGWERFVNGVVEWRGISVSSGNTGGCGSAGCGRFIRCGVSSRFGCRMLVICGIVGRRKMCLVENVICMDNRENEMK